MLTLGQIVGRSKNRSPGGYQYRCAPAGDHCLGRNQYHGLIDLLPRLARIASVLQNPGAESSSEIKEEREHPKDKGIYMRQLEKVLWAAKALTIGGSAGMDDGRRGNFRGLIKLPAGVLQ